MKKISLKDIERAVFGKIIKGAEDMKISSVSIDSRKCEYEGLFVPLKGEKRDGHDFIEDAAKRGCVFTLTEKEDVPLSVKGAVLVGNTLKALTDLSKWYLSTFDLKKVAVTGSMGKTSTKDMIYEVLNKKYKAAKTVGNFNNHIGLPLTILSLEEGTEVCVFEMGMDRLGEIHHLADIVRPDVAVITNVGHTHLEHLKTRENILRAKLEVTDFLERDNTLIVNMTGDLLTKEGATGDYNLLTVGFDGRSDYIINSIEDKDEEGLSFHIEREGRTLPVKLPVSGRHNAINASLALAAGEVLGVSLEDGISALSKVVLTDKRLKILIHNGIKIIDDTYNASPESMMNALDVLNSRQCLRKIAVLADMFELGTESERLHKEIGEYIGELNVDLVVTIGELSYNINLGAKDALEPSNNLHFNDKEEFLQVLPGFLNPGDCILVKGSRGMEMDKVVSQILKL